MKSESKTVPETVKTVTISIEEYEGLKAENARLNQQVQWLLEGMKLSRRKLFGASSEKSSASEQLSFLFNEAEVYEDQAAATEEETVPVSAHERRRRSGSVKDVLPENVLVDIVEHRIPEEERICEECGTVMQEIGKEVRRTLQIIPARSASVRIGTTRMPVRSANSSRRIRRSSRQRRILRSSPAALPRLKPLRRS